MAKIVSLKLEKWMTSRDRKIITAVYQHEILNSKQIEKLFFLGNKNSRIIALRRLKKLVDNKFLKQHWYGYDSSGTMQHFTITNRGAMITSSELGIDISSIKINDANIVSNIEHKSLIADFHINLVSNGIEVDNFTTEKHNRYEFIYSGRKFIFEPDGKGVITTKTKQFPFLLEMDRGTMSYNYFKLKLPNYEAFYASNIYKNEFNVFPIVFIITSDNIRLKRLYSLVEKNSKSDITYLISTIDNMYTPQNEVFHVIGKNRIIGIT